MNAFEYTKELISTIFSCDLEGKVITIIAPSGMGKTTLTCMQLPVYYYLQAKNSETLSENYKILILNTDDSLLNDRFLQLLSSFEISYSEIRKYVRIEQIDNFDKQHSYLTYIIPKILEEKKLDIRYIVIDPLNHSLRKRFAETKPEYRLNITGRLSPMLEHQVIQLTQIARKYNIPVLLTLLPKKQYTDKVPTNWQNAYFGPLEIAHCSDIVLWFSYSQKSNAKISIHVKKHRLKEEGEVFYANIRDFGLELVKE